METVRHLGLWIVLFYGLLVIVFIMLKKVQVASFNQENLDYLISGISRYRDKTDDLCKYTLYGDPKNVGNNWIKFRFSCGEDRNVISTMALVNIKDYSFDQVLGEYLRVINFDKSEWIRQNWKCFYDNMEVNYETLLKETATIYCKML